MEYVRQQQFTRLQRRKQATICRAAEGESRIRSQHQPVDSQQPIWYTKGMATPIDQIRQLPVAEQLAIVEQIWDGLHESPELLQEWQIEEARRRSKEIESDPSIAISENDVWKRVDELLE